MLSYKRRKENEQKEKASYDYRLADIIAYSIARIYKAEVKYPSFMELYPELFDKEEIKRMEEEKRHTEMINNFLAQVRNVNQTFNNKGG